MGILCFHSTWTRKEVDTTQSHTQGNGNNPQPQIEKVYEPLDEGRWTELDTDTQRRELTFSEELRQELELPESDEESDSN